MKNKINFYTMGDINYPSSRYRVFLPVKYLNKNKIDYGIKPIISILHSPFRFFREIINLDKKKSVFIQKAFNYSSIILIKLAKIFGKKIIFDFDDAIFLNSRRKVNWILRNSSLIIAGNSFLARYAKKFNKNVTVIPTSIDLENIGPFKIKKVKNNRIVIGWIGTRDNLKYLDEVINVLEELSEHNEIELRIIGPKDTLNYMPKFDKLDVNVIPWKLETEWEELSKIDIGIMPLPDDDWSRGKCGLKLLQYMALGIPAVGSRVGANKEIIKEGVNGFLASSEEEWFNALEKLIKKQNLRKKIGREGRKTVEKDFSLEANMEKFIKVLSELNK